MAAKGDQKLKKRKAMEQIRRVQAILRRWDPLAVLPGEFAPADEYDDYAPHIVSLVLQGCSLDALCEHLADLRTGMAELNASLERDRDIALEIMAALQSTDGRRDAVK